LACALLLAGCAAAERTQISRAGISTGAIFHPAGLPEADAERVVAQAIVAHEIRRP